VIEGKRVLITGGAGFIGTSLALKLAETCDVVLFDNLHRNAYRETPLVDNPRVHLFQGDVLDVAAVREASKGCHVVVHMAAIAGVDTVMRSPVLTMRVALQGTINVLDAAFEGGTCERFVDFSTSEVFGRYAYKVTEGDQNQLGAVGEARWTYAVSKLATEHLALSYHRQHGFPACSIRPFNIFGPRQVGEGAIHHFIVRALSGADIRVHNDGSQIRSWCYIDDIVEGILLVLERPEAVGEAFNIGNPRSTLTIYNLAREVVRLAGSSSRIELVPWPYADVELRIPDVSKARKLLGYEPRVDLEEGLLSTIDWYRGRAK
jgi:nucleoside-diphosphate-sugar epimerase